MLVVIQQTADTPLLLCGDSLLTLAQVNHEPKARIFGKMS
jgi:hypothetical protein